MIYNYRINSSNVTMISILLAKSSLNCIQNFVLHAIFKALIKQYSESTTSHYAKKGS